MAITPSNQLLYSNFVEGTLARELATAGLTMYVDGYADFPSPSAGQAFRATLWDGTQDPEIVECTANAGDGSFTITRAKESTVAKTWPAGTLVRIAPTAEGLQVLASVPRYGVQWFKKTIDTDVTVPDGYVALLMDATIQAGVTITVQSGGTLIIGHAITNNGTLTVEAGGTAVTLDSTAIP